MSEKTRWPPRSGEVLTVDGEKSCVVVGIIS